MPWGFLPYPRLLTHQRLEPIFHGVFFSIIKTESLFFTITFNAI